MDRKRIVEAIDQEIGRLEHARDLLSAVNGRRALIGVRAKTNGSHPAKKRILSDDARNRIAQAQKRRWAKHHKEIAQASKA